MRLGLPTSGPGAVASGTPCRGPVHRLVRSELRVLLVARGTSPWTPGSLAQPWPLVAWAVIVTAPDRAERASPGQHLLNLRVIRLDRRPVRPVDALIRTVLIALVIPPLVADADRRGWHDLAVGTVVVNGPRGAR